MTGNDPLAPETRASDSERENAIERLRTAMAEGRLSLEELTDRTEVAYAARTRGQLAELTADIPGRDTPPAERSGQDERSWLVGALGDLKRTGSWDPRGQLGSVAVLGDVVIDLCGARLPTGAIDIRAYAIFGDVRIVVPRGVQVEMGGVALLGDTKSDTEEPTGTDPPTVRVTGYAVFGDVKVSHPKVKKPSRWRSLLGIPDAS